MLLLDRKLDFTRCGGCLVDPHQRWVTWVVATGLSRYGAVPGPRRALFLARRKRGSATNRTQASKTPARNAQRSIGHMIGMTCMCGTSEVPFDGATPSVGNVIRPDLISITGIRGIKPRIPPVESFSGP